MISDQPNSRNSTPAPAHIPVTDNLYPLLLPTCQHQIHEPAIHYRTGFHWSERHLQCVWFDDRLRPPRLFTEDHESLVVESPGRWNLEAGPDFLDATIRVGPEQRRLTGDVEVHVRPSDWDHHRHDRAGLYRHVMLHVTYFATPALSAGNASGMLQLALADPLAALRAFSFDDVDLSAYPHAVLPQTPRPCGLALRDTPDRWEPLLAAAGRHRLQCKAQRLRERLARLQDRNQLLYEETLAALGYKHNSAAFRRLAQHVPLHTWDASSPRIHPYARLLGAAGLLPDLARVQHEESQQFVRTLWDHWWHDPVQLPAGETITIIQHATRPTNTPVRRLAAAAALFHGPTPLATTLLAIPRTPGARWFADIAACLENRLAWDFWNGHLSLSRPRTSRPVALIGKTRLAALITNVILPLTEGELPAELLNHLPPEDISAPMRETAHALFGRDHNPALYATNGLYQQGLLQIHHDFCLNARAGCAHCALSAKLSETPLSPDPSAADALPTPK